MSFTGLIGFGAKGGWEVALGWKRSWIGYGMAWHWVRKESKDQRTSWKWIRVREIDESSR